MKSGIFFTGVLALASAALIWLASPGGGDMVGLSFVMLMPLLSAVAIQSDGKVRARTFFTGWLCGFAAYLSLLYWIVFVLEHYGGLPWFTAVPLLLLLAAYMALYTGLFALGFSVLWPRDSALGVALCLFAAPAFWVGLDWLRGWLFTGFPWMDIGYFLAFSPKLIQCADLFGHHGITYLLVMANVFVMLLGLSGKRHKTTGRWALAPMLSIVVMILLIAVVYSDWRLHALRTASSPRIRLGVVQGNISQDMKWSPANREATLVGYLEQSENLLTKEHPELLLWPETALPFYPQRSPLTAELQAFTARSGVPVLSGAPWLEADASAEQGVRLYNGAALFTLDGRFAATYFKSHLVPFGEYVPLHRYLPFIAPLVETVGNFSAGRVEKPMEWGRARIGVLICYESVFPDMARAWVNAGANVLVNLTNDAWYGRSSAPRHSLAMAVLRAVETRRSLARAANTGFSVFISPQGELRQLSPLFAPWAAVDEVVLRDERTVYVRFGYLFAPACLLFALLTLAVVWRRKI